jgi:hypothetical protein
MHPCSPPPTSHKPTHTHTHARTHRALAVVTRPDAVPQLAALAQLLHHVHVVLVLVHVHQLDDVEAARQLAQHLQLAPNAVDVTCPLLVGEVALQHLADGLAGKLLACRAALHHAHDAVAALAQLPAPLVGGLDVPGVPKVHHGRLGRGRVGRSYPVCRAGS